MKEQDNYRGYNHAVPEYYLIQPLSLMTEKNLKEEISRLRKFSPPKPSTYEKLRALKGEHLIDTYYGDVMTNLLERLPEHFQIKTDLGMRQELQTGMMDQDDHGIDLLVWNDTSIHKEGYTGSYNQSERSIRIAHEEPSRFEILQSLGERGMLPEAIEVFGHEISHHYQYNYIDSGKGFSVQRPLHPELEEAQAYLVSDSHMPNKHIVQRILTARKKDGDLVYSGMRKDRLESALRSFRILNDLSVPQKGIADLVRNPGKWDEKRQEYENIAYLLYALTLGQRFEDIERVGRLRQEYYRLKTRYDLNRMLFVLLRENNLLRKSRLLSVARTYETLFEKTGMLEHAIIFTRGE